MTDYYHRHIAGERLDRCYELATPAVRRYLEAELQALAERVPAGATLLELGCGTGRAAFRLAERARRLVGVDVAAASLALAARRAAAAAPGTAAARCRFARMDALRLGLGAAAFDAVVCCQNGVAAFRADPLELAREALRVLRPGGCLLLASYADAFWPHRLEWFEAQAAAGLIGPLDRSACRDGTIVCRDGFRSGRMDTAGFRALAAGLGLAARLDEVAGAALVCELRRPLS